MAVYKMQVVETLTRIIEVEADNIDDALAEAEFMYSNGEIILYADDFDAAQIHYHVPDETGKMTEEIYYL